MLNFNEAAYTALNRDKRAAETQNPYAPLQSANALAQTVGGFGQDMQARREKEKKDQLQQLLLQMKQQQMGMDQQKNNYEYGQPIDPNIMNVDPQAKPMLGQSFFMPGGQGQVASPSSLIDRFNQWRAGGMKQQGAEADFMPALGSSERKYYFETQNPKPQPMFMSPYQAGSLDLKKQELGLKEKEIENKRQSEAASKEQSAQQAMQKAQIVKKKIDEAIALSGITSTGIGGQLMSHVSGSKAKNLRAALDTIKANLGFDQLMSMKSASKNGASGLGALSDNEMLLLTSLSGKLDPDAPEQLASNLLALKEKYSNFNNALGFEGGSQQIVQRNKKTGQVRISNDGGKTWQMQQ